eukprot:scaffold116947_cov20-Cyclotella_meneghiniana.AAC.1
MDDSGSSSYRHHKSSCLAMSACDPIRLAKSPPSAIAVTMSLLLVSEEVLWLQSSAYTKQV